MNDIHKKAKVKRSTKHIIGPSQTLPDFNKPPADIWEIAELGATCLSCLKYVLQRVSAKGHSFKPLSLINCTTKPLFQVPAIFSFPTSMPIPDASFEFKKLNRNNNIAQP